jgi:hypothetical protein
MLFLIVLLAWLAAIGYVPYHFRHLPTVRSFFAGFQAVWWSMLTAKEYLPESFYSHPYEDASQNGQVCAVLSVIFTLLAVVIMAGFTLYWAW